MPAPIVGATLLLTAKARGAAALTKMNEATGGSAGAIGNLTLKVSGLMGVLPIFGAFVA